MRLATIGTSWITNDFINSVKEVGKWELTSIYSRDIENAKSFANKHGVTAYYDDLDKMATSDIDIVYIASPNSLHIPQVRLFIENKKHVICEKPMSASYDEMNELFSIAEKNKVFLFEAFRHINMPTFSILMKSLSKIQPIRSCVLSYNQYSSRYPAFLRGENPNVFNPEMDGGALLDLGVYPLSLAVALFGEPAEIQRSLYRLSNGVDGAGSVILNYKDFIVNVSFSKICQDVIENQFLGENGAITIDKSAELTNIRYYTNDGVFSEIPTSNSLIYENRMAYEVARFAHIIENRDFDTYYWLKKVSLQTCKLVEKIRS